MQQIARRVRERGASVGLEVVVNAVLPFVIYQMADARLGDVGALLASSAPPIAWSVAEFARRRRVDALSMLVLAGIVLSLLAMAGGGGAKFLQLRENLVTAVIGLVFLGSALVRRPLILYLARAAMRRSSPARAATFEQVKDAPPFRRLMMVMTLVWGVGLMARTLTACVLVFSVPIPTYLIVQPILGYASMGALVFWTFWYARRWRSARMADPQADGSSEAAESLEVRPA